MSRKMAFIRAPPSGGDGSAWARCDRRQGPHGGRLRRSWRSRGSFVGAGGPSSPRCVSRPSLYRALRQRAPRARASGRLPGPNASSEVPKCSTRPARVGGNRGLLPSPPKCYVECDNVLISRTLSFPFNQVDSLSIMQPWDSHQNIIALNEVERLSVRLLAYHGVAAGSASRSLVGSVGPSRDVRLTHVANAARGACRVT